MRTHQTAPIPNHGSRLAIVTFVVVLVSTSLVGLLVAPALLSRAEARYLSIQADSNARQARAIARFAAARFESGLSKDEVIAEVQTMLTGADVELGYSCVIDRTDAKFLSHPMQMAIGMPVSSKKAEFSPIQDRSELEPWAQAITDGEHGSGALFYPDNSEEIVYMQEVLGTPWVVTTHENTERMRGALADLRSGITRWLLALGLVFASVASLAARLVSRRHERLIEAEQARSDLLLLNILPPAISQRLKDASGVIADRHTDVTVLFADIVGFTDFASQRPSLEVVSWLNELFSQFDDICARHGLEKIKTIGDAYMLCGGLDGDAEVAVKSTVAAALEMLAATKLLGKGVVGHDLSVRIGIHTGDLVAGVIGKRKFAYDVWGDVVNTASRLESSGVTNRIQISDVVATNLDGTYSLEDRGAIELKGKGKMQAWLVEAAL